MKQTGVVARLRRHKWLLRIAGGLLFVLFLFAAQRVWWSIGLERYDAPPLAGALLDGGQYDLAREPAGTRMVYFWASWCPDCRAHQGTINALMGEQDVITVATRSGTEPEVRQYLAESGLRWRVLNDPQGELAKHWKARGVPKMFIINRHGQVRFQMYGSVSGIGLRARLWFAEHF